MYHLSNILFLAHFIGICITHIGWIIYPQILFIHPFVILSWIINRNKCIISQIEYFMFGRTFMGYGKKYYVPSYQRYLLYLNFIIGLFVNYYIS